MANGEDYAAWAMAARHEIPAVPGYGPTLIAVHGPLGQALYVSPEAIAVAGVPATTLMGDGGAERIVQGDLPVVVEAYAQGIESRASIALVCRHMTDNGEQWWLCTHFQVMQDPHMERIVFLAISRQTTEPAQGAHFWSLAEGPHPTPPTGTPAQTRPEGMASVPAAPDASPPDRESMDPPTRRGP